MKLLKDRDFRISVVVASLILLHLFFSIFANISSYMKLKALVPRQTTFNPDFIVIELIAFVISTVALYITLKVAKVRSNWLKLCLGFVYSLLSTYFIIYKFILVDFYHIKLEGGDWGYLAVILGWPVYFVVSIPLLILVYKIASKANEIRLKIGSVLIMLPTVFGIIMLLILTFSGRLIYQRIYEQKNSQLTQFVKLNNHAIYSNNVAFDSDCKCTRPQLTGSIEISNNVDFPVMIKMYMDKPEFFCKLDNEFKHLLKKGVNAVEFKCSSNEQDINLEGISIDEFRFSLDEANNAGVSIQKQFSNFE